MLDGKMKVRGSKGHSARPYTTPLATGADAATTTGSLGSALPEPDDADLASPSLGTCDFEEEDERKARRESNLPGATPAFGLSGVSALAELGVLGCWSNVRDGRPVSGGVRRVSSDGGEVQPCPKPVTAALAGGWSGGR